MPSHMMRIDKRTGEMTCIYTDRIAPLIAHAQEAKTVRASHVEPTTDGKWAADMRPAVRDLGLGSEDLNDPALQLGPFTLHSEALAAETEWINSRLRSSTV